MLQISCFFRLTVQVRHTQLNDGGTSTRSTQLPPDKLCTFSALSARRTTRAGVDRKFQQLVDTAEHMARGARGAKC